MASTAYQRVFVCPLRLMTTRAVSIRQLDRRLTSQPRDVASRKVPGSLQPPPKGLRRTRSRRRAVTLTTRQSTTRCTPSRVSLRAGLRPCSWLFVLLVDPSRPHRGAEGRLQSPREFPEQPVAHPPSAPRRSRDKPDVSPPFEPFRSFPFVSPRRPTSHPSFVPLRSSLVPTWIVIDAHRRRRHRVPSNREFVKMMRSPTFHSASAGDSCTCAFTLICTSKGTRRHTFEVERTARLQTPLVAEPPSRSAFVTSRISSIVAPMDSLCALTLRARVHRGTQHSSDQNQR
jgi:hypothetical protein